jgi:hypothetical protein
MTKPRKPPRPHKQGGHTNRRMPNEWIRLRDDYRRELQLMAGSMIARGIAEKAVNVRAAQTALMATMVKEAMVRAGLPQAAVSRVGDELRQLALEAQTGGS